MSGQIFKFGVFELKPETGELWKYGVRVKLQTKPLQVLEALLMEPGEVVTREELFKKLWPTGTYVDFESGLNTATNRLRVALGDSADAPRYIETLPRLGYRFICPVIEKGVTPLTAEPALVDNTAEPAQTPIAVAPRPSRKLVGKYQTAAAAVLLLLTVILLLVYARSKASDVHLQPTMRTETGHGLAPRSSLSFTRSAPNRNLN